MTKPKTHAPIAAFTLAALVLSWTPAFACSGNPLDSVGVAHNIYLGCLMRNGGDPKVSPLQRLVDECGFDPGMSTEELVTLYAPLVEADPYLTIAERMEKYKESYTDDQFSYFHRIDQIIAKAKDTTAADEAFAELENEAIAQLTTSTAAERSIFAALSIARHSLRYWVKAFGIEGVAGEPVGKTAPILVLKIGKFWRAVIIVAADIAGGVAAGSAGANSDVAGGVAAGASAAARELIDHPAPQG